MLGPKTNKPIARCLRSSLAVLELLSARMLSAHLSFALLLSAIAAPAFAFDTGRR
jgi:hypothetical protein